MRLAVPVMIIALAGCEDGALADLPITGEGLAVTADAIFVESDGALYVAPRNGVPPRVIAEANPERTACERDAAIEVVGDEVFWLERDGYLHRVNLATGKTDEVFSGCPHSLVTDAGVVYWNRFDGAEASLWRWLAGRDPERVGPAPDRVITIRDGWMYGFEDQQLVRQTLGGEAREVLHTTPRPESASVGAVDDGFLYFTEVVASDRVELRVPVGGGEVEVLGEILGSTGRTVVVEGVVYKGHGRLRPGETESEAWLPRGVGNLALAGDDIFWLAGDDYVGPWVVVGRHKDGPPLP